MDIFLKKVVKLSPIVVVFLVFLRIHAFGAGPVFDGSAKLAKFGAANLASVQLWFSFTAQVALGHEGHLLLPFSLRWTLRSALFLSFLLSLWHDFPPRVGTSRMTMPKIHYVTKYSEFTKKYLSFMIK
jgi:hypothetical protein